ncbi:MAG: Fic family protein [Bacteroidales bacterium]|nr:Fic family protein [Bacteroidales bacterium]
MIILWIHEHPNWTQFKWNIETLSLHLADIRFRQGRLFGRMENLGFDLKQESKLNMVTDDILSSSSIEGEILNPTEVRSSIARRLHLDIAGMGPSTHHIDGVVEMMLDATQNYNEPVTTERLFGWHAALFPTERSSIHKISVGKWRTVDTGVMQVISGPMGREKVHYEAVDAARIEHEMNRFLTWCANEQKIDPVLQAGIAHFWFVTIHPFEDGNGRIARALTDLFLARADGSPERFYTLSRQIEANRKTYYTTLEKQQRGSQDITLWLDWYLHCLDLSLTHSETALSSILFKSHLWDKINTKGVNERQRLIINRMLTEEFKGYMNTSKYAKIARCSNDTALRDIQDLKAKQVFLQNAGGGRSTSYRLPDTILNSGDNA